MRWVVSLCFFSTLALAQQPWFFAVMSDPQFGMYAKDQNFAQETANFEFAVASINRLHPRFVVICGDLVNKHGDTAEIAEYKRILKQVDPGIPVYSVAGNHDVGNVPTPETLDAYRTNIGPDHYTFTSGDIEGIVLDSNLIRSPESAPSAAKAQEEWLVKTLQEAPSNPQSQIVVFQHIPFFLKSADEPDDYFNIPKPTRRKYLDLLEESGVRYVFAGHYHRNAGGIDGQLTEFVSGAVGMPLGGSLSGFRIVPVRGRDLTSTWFCFGDIPNQIDLAKPLKTSCPQ
ncbi:MAG TPA: metallophosphoesterase [Bryobacteraceae bacterium]|jgi:3',5'-cyclic AMP phosphodiesterase CpdA|nr:metallophosphoesterase [Bryobacteraceae bacterium]